MGKKQNGESTLERAVDCYLQRNEKVHEHRVHPNGHWITLQDIRIWVIDRQEVRKCCGRIKSGEAEKFSGQWLLRHCRSYEHVSKLFGIKEKELRDGVSRRKRDEKRKNKERKIGQLPLFDD